MRLSYAARRMNISCVVLGVVIKPRLLERPNYPKLWGWLTFPLGEGRYYLPSPEATTSQWILDRAALVGGTGM
jgi:hypothetical protein